MKKVFLLFVVILSVNKAFSQTIESAPEWAACTIFPAQQQAEHEMGTGLLFFKPTTNGQRQVSPSALHLMILVKDGKNVRVMQAPVHRIEIARGNTEIDWSVFDRPVTTGTNSYQRPLMITYHRYWDGENAIYYVTL